MTTPREGGGEPLAQDCPGELADTIAQSFDDFAGFKTQTSKGADTTQGTGWGVLASPFRVSVTDAARP